MGFQKRDPSVFWRMTLREYDLAVSGHNKSLGAKASGRGMGAKRLAELKAQFPDTPKAA